MSHKYLRKILIIRLSSLGDIIHSTASIEILREWDCEVHFLTKPPYASLIKACVPRVYPHIYDPGIGERRARQKLFHWMDEVKFDHIIDLHDNLRTRLWRRSLRKRAPLSIAYKPRLKEILVLLFRLKKRASLGRGGRALLYKKAAMSCLQTLGAMQNLESPRGLTRLEFSSKLSPSVHVALPKEDFVVFLPGAAWEGKRWGVESFMELAYRFPAPVVVLGSIGELFCDRIAAAGSPGSVSLRGKTSLVDCAGVLKQARVVVGNDTGLLHMAEALGKDVIALEGPTSPALGFSAYRAKSLVLGEKLFCRPCSKSGSFCWRWGSRACLRDLSKDKVYKALHSMWN